MAKRVGVLTIGTAAAGTYSGVKDVYNDLKNISSNNGGTNSNSGSGTIIKGLELIINQVVIITGKNQNTIFFFTSIYK